MGKEVLGVGAVPAKSWRKINEERKALKKQRKQEKALKNLEKSQQLESKLSQTGEEKPKQNPSTVSIAVPGSILENAQSAELRSYVAGQIARAACIFRVNEVIVFDDVVMSTMRETKRNYAADEDEHETVRGSSLQLARILQYLECPQYLRKFFFPMHKDLKYAGLLNPLDAPHHLRQQNVFLYREGVVLGDKKAKAGHSYVNAGLLNDVLVNKAIEPGLRVTLKLENLQEGSRKLRGTVVSPDEPRRETGVYWGYNVRIAHTLSEIFTRSPYDGGYDVTIGTSDRGGRVHDVPNGSYQYNHLLIVFGGLQGLEAALANDDKLTVDEPALLFDHYVNTLPKQGSRTIRTEEALLISMAALQEKLQPQNEELQTDLSEFLPRSEDTGMQQQDATTVSTYKVPAPRSRNDKNTNMAKCRNDERNNDNNIETSDFMPSLRSRNDKNTNVTKPRNNERNSDKNREIFDVMPSPKKAKLYVDDVDADFEVVPSNKAQERNKVQTTEAEDLSRFD